MRKLWKYYVSVGLVALVAGCGGEKLGTVPVTGTVKFKGQTVDDAVVTLAPVDPAGRVAVARTDSTGQFKMMTLGEQGVMPGKYTVTISKTDAPPPTVSAVNTAVSDQAAIDAQYKAHEEELKKGSTPKVPKDVLPLKYKAAATSGLTAEIKGATKDLNFDLTE